MKNLIYNGKSLNRLGFVIKTRPTYTAANRSISFQSVLGKSGDVIIDEQRYENVEMSYEINSMPHLVSAGSSVDLARELIDWLSPDDGEYKILRDDWNRGYFCEAICTNIGEIANNLFLGLDTTVKFSRKPFWYSDLGQEVHTTYSKNETIHLINPEVYQSEPLITIYGNGNMDLYVNTGSTNIYHLTNIEGNIAIDSETGNASCDGAMCNEKTSFDYPPTFSSGNNWVKITPGSGATFTKAEVIPRWRRL